MLRLLRRQCRRRCSGGGKPPPGLKAKRPWICSPRREGDTCSPLLADLMWLIEWRRRLPLDWQKQGEALQMNFYLWKLANTTMIGFLLLLELLSSLPWILLITCLRQLLREAALFSDRPHLLKPQGFQVPIQRKTVTAQGWPEAAQPLALPSPLAAGLPLQS